MKKDANLAKYAAVSLAAGLFVFLVVLAIPQPAVLEPQTPPQIGPGRPTLAPTAGAKQNASVQAPCVNGTQKEFLCVGEISGTQTYYECEGGKWVSKSRLNASACAKVEAPYNPYRDNSTLNGTAGA